MNETEKHNGWKNYETWNINLWIRKKDGLFGYLKSLAKEAQDSWELADIIREEIEENNPLSDQASLYSDILGAGLRRADYREIAEALLEDVV